MQGESRLAEALRKLRDGDWSVRLDGDGEEVQAFNALVDQCVEFRTEASRICREIAREGYFGGQMEIPGAKGEWKAMADELNDVSRAMTIQTRAFTQVAKARAGGEIGTVLTLDLPGESRELRDAINATGPAH